MRLTRRGFSIGGALTGGLALAGCSDDAPRLYPPIRYDYLTPMQLTVASIDAEPLPPPGPLDAESPAPAGPALLQMAQDRLLAGGSGGRAIITVDQARIIRRNGGLEGAFTLHIDIQGTDGKSVAFAEASVSRRKGEIDRDLRAALYDFTRQMLDDMNVELEFQIRRSLKAYLQTTSVAPAPAPVQQQDLAPDPSQRLY